jgi:hypothetical protein
LPTAASARVIRLVVPLSPNPNIMEEPTSKVKPWRWKWAAEPPGMMYLRGGGRAVRRGEEGSDKEAGERRRGRWTMFHHAPPGEI